MAHPLTAVPAADPFRISSQPEPRRVNAIGAVVRWEKSGDFPILESIMTCVVFITDFSSSLDICIE